ncbi:retinol dehydrogenase 13-like isoform X2 [Cimex lectularius]|uniref:Uncharacterized protein n=1 Tax=Cimex lectularius TaxID=79782 RepID=A0A8I6RS14_CIMLE|nr:retinol dehydrogenase 13-like isoform X2 [Cimex lectularius]
MGNFLSAKYVGKERIDGKCVVITGGNEGIGKYTALNLCKQVIACRSVQKGKDVAKWIEEKLQHKEKHGDVKIVQLDLSSLTSVRECADSILETEKRIDILINNAGVMFTPHKLSEDGYEIQFATNHLGHFLFTLLLLPRILASRPARIINLSSVAHYYCKSMEYEDLNMVDDYSPFRAYTRSKAANVLFTTELANRLKGRGVNVYAVHPGIVQTRLWKHSSDTICPGVTFIMDNLGFLFGKTPAQGAQTTLYCALSEEVDSESGFYYDNCRKKAPSEFVLNRDEAELLFVKSSEYVNLSSDPYDPFTPDSFQEQMNRIEE